MTYDEKIAKLRSMLEEHNKRLPEGFPKVVIDGEQGVMTKLMVEGGTTDEGLSEFTATDLKGFGFPTAASKAAARFIVTGDEHLIISAPQQTSAGHATAQVTQQTPTGQQLIRVSMTDPATEIEEASNLELITRLNPVPGQTGRVGAELDRRARGEAFLGYTTSNTVAVAESAARLHAIQNNQRVGETMMVEGRPVRPRRVGEAYLPQRVRVNYLFPEETLIPPDLECARTGESMIGIPDDVAQILILEALRPGGRPWGNNIEAARSVIEMARRSNASAEVRRRYKLAAVQYDELAPNERPALERADDSSTIPQEAGRGRPFVGSTQTSVWGGTPGATPRVIAPSDMPPLTYRDVTKALNSAFRSRTELVQMVRTGLDENMDTFVSDNLGLAGVIHELVGWAESAGRLKALAKAAYEARPGNELLKALVGIGPQQTTGNTYNISDSTVHASAFGTNAIATSGSRQVRDRTDNDRLRWLSIMLPGEFDGLVQKLGVPPAYISGSQAPQATRAVDVMRWARTARRVCDMDDVLDEIVGKELVDTLT